MYHAKAYRLGDKWQVEVDGFPGLLLANRVEGVERVARDHIAKALVCPRDHVTVQVDVMLPEVVKTHIAKAEQSRALAKHAQSIAAKESRMAVLALREAGLTVREIGRALGISHQRAQQLLETAA